MRKNLALKLTIDASGNIKGYVGDVNSGLKDMGNQAIVTGNKADTAFAKTRKGVESISTQLQRAKQELIGLVAIGGFAQLASQAISFADSYKSLNGQLDLVTESTAELYSVQAKLHAIALETRADLGAMAKMYSALSPSLNELGKSLDERIRLVQTFNKALALTSPTSAESASAILQFSQAIGSGVLRGEEFNAIMENGRGVAQTLADGLQVPIGALRAMAEQGQLTADVVIAALESQSETVDAKFATLPLTVSGAMQNLRTELMVTIGEFDNAMDVTESLAGLIVLTAKHADDLAVVIGVSLTAGALAKAVPAMYALAAANTATTISFVGTQAAAIALTLQMHGLRGAVIVTTVAMNALLASTIRFMATPWGAVATAAAAAIVYLALSEDDASDKTGKLTGELEKQNAQLEHLKGNADGTATALINLGNEVRDLIGLDLAAEFKAQADAAQWLTDMNADIAALQFEMDKDSAKERLSIQEKINKLVLSEAQQRAIILDGLHPENRALMEKLYALEDQEKANDALVEQHKEFVDWADRELDLIERQDKALDDQTRTLERKANVLRFGDAYNAEIEALKEINQLYQLGMISYDEMQDALFEAEANSLGFVDEVIDGNDLIEKSYENLFRRLDDGFANLWRDILSGQADLITMLRSGAIDIGAEILHSMTTKPLTDGFASYLSGNNSQSLLSNLNSAYSLGTNPFITQGMTAAYGAGFSTANAAIANYWTTGQYGAAAQYAAGSYLPVIGGALYGYSENGVAGGLASGAGAYYGAQLGTAILPGIGTAIGSILGAIGGNELISGIFGGDWQTKDTGLSLAATLSGVDADYYQYQKKDGGWFGSDKKRTQYTDAAEVESSLTDIVALALTNLDANANALGLDLADDFTTTIKASLKGLDESEIRAKVQEMLVDIYSQAADSIDGLNELVAPLAVSGETAADTLSRVITQFNTVDGTLERLGANLGDLSENGLSAAQNILNLVGGLDQFVALSQSFYANFYSDTEQFADLTESLKTQLSAVNLLLPSTRDGYRDLVEQLQSGTAAEQERAAVLLSLNEVASEYYDTLEARQNALLESLSTAYDKYVSQSQSIREGLIALQGDEALLAYQREQQLEQLDPLLQAQQTRLWALQDEADKIESLNAVWSSFKSQLSDVKDYLSGTFANIKTFTASIVLGGAVASGAAYADQLALANANDRTALSSITQTAQQYIDSSGITDPAQLNLLKAQIAADLNGLTQISAEEFLASEISKSLAEQTSSLSVAIETLPDGLQAVVSSAEYQVQTLIDFATNDAGIEPTLRAILYSAGTGFERTLLLSVDATGLEDNLQRLLLDSMLTSTVNLNAQLSSDTSAELTGLIADSYVSAQALIDATLSDGTADEIDNLVLNNLVNATAIIDATLDSDIETATKELIVGDTKDYLARIGAVYDLDLSDTDATTLVQAYDAIYRNIVTSATLDAPLSDDYKRLLYDATIIKTLGIENIGTLAADQAIAFGLTDSTASALLSILNSGTISQAYLTARGMSDTDAQALLSILNSGTISQAYLTARGMSDTDAAATLEIINAGAISQAYLTARGMSDTDAAATLEIINAGTISQAYLTARGMSDTDAAATLEIINSGTISQAYLTARGMSDTDAAATLEIINSGSISSSIADAFALVDSTAIKTLIAAGGELTASQQAIIDVITGTTTAQLDATVALSGQDLTDIEGNTGSIADRALDQLAALNTLDTTMQDSVAGLIDLNTSVLGLTDEIKYANYAAAIPGLLDTKNDLYDQYESLVLSQRSFVNLSIIGEDLNRLNQIQDMLYGLAENGDAPWADYYAAWDAYSAKKAEYAEAAAVAAEYQDVGTAGLEALYDQYLAAQDKYDSTLAYVNNYIDGSHEAGLPYVPFDGYIGQLHEGEGVIDRSTMSSLRRYGIGVNTGNSNNNEIVRELREMNAKLDKLIDKADATQATQAIREMNQREKKWDLKGLPQTRVTVGQGVV